MLEAVASPSYIVRCNIVPGYTCEGGKPPYCASIIIFFVRESFHTKHNYSFQDQSTLASPGNAPMDDDFQAQSPVCPGIWYSVPEFVCHDCIAPHLDVARETHPVATVHHAKPSPKQKD